MNRELLLTRSVPDTIPDETLHRVAPHDRLSLRAAADETGSFEGYAVVWDTEDAYGTTFAPACFSAGGLDAELYALLLMHNPTMPIGTFTAREDDTGLWIAGGWDDTVDGRDARVRAKSGSAPELSVGFVPIMVDPEDEDRFTQVRLVEVSQITARMAAVPGAGFSGVRRQPDAKTGRAALARAALLLSDLHAGVGGTD